MCAPFRAPVLLRQVSGSVCIKGGDRPAGNHENHVARRVLQAGMPAVAIASPRAAPNRTSGPGQKKRNAIVFARSWGDTIGAPVGTTEGWGHGGRLDHRDRDRGFLKVPVPE
jgi:hypothetical protein